MVTFEINGQVANVEEGMTILDAAKKLGIKIPHLCYDPRLKPYGGCRLCLVEIEGARNPVPSCAAKVTEGMKVQTDTVTLHEIRKTIVELLLSNHPQECLTCENTGQCALQDIAYELGVREISFEGEKHFHTVTDPSPFVEREMDKCIVCARCVRICRDVQHCSVYTLAFRGFEIIPTTPYDKPLTESNCVFCGQCISTCPTGALTSKISRFKGRPWQTQSTTTTCPYCGVGCQLELITKDGEIIDIQTFPGEGVNKGNLCVKGRFGYGFVNHHERLKTPYIRKEGELKEASWDEALDYIAVRLKEVKKESGPDAIGFLSSSKCTNEENYLLQRLARAAIGTNNIDNCARL
jgi:predicted molibdopterin-dependent oxidoreductase YjgC